MPVSVRNLGVRLLSIAAVSAVSIGLPAAVAGAAPKQPLPGKDFTMVVETPELAGVTDAAYEITLKNVTGTQVLGSADVTVPPEITILSRNGLGGTGQTLELRNLGVPPGGTVTVRPSLRMPCVETPGAWAVVAKQSNDFSGSGNWLTLAASGNVLTTEIQDSCALRFDANPASAEKSSRITSVAFHPESAELVSVQAVDATGVDTESFDGEITLTSAPAAMPAAKSTAVAGFATFPAANDPTGLRIATPGNYQLRAAASGLTSGDSNIFQVIEVVEDCNTVGCSAPSPQGAKSKATLTGSLITGSGFALMTPNIGGSADPGLDPLSSAGCDGYVAPGADYYEFRLFGDGLTGAKTVVVEYTKAAMRMRGLSSLEVCYAAPEGFTAKDGLPAPHYDYDGSGPLGVGSAGLLPNCPSTPVEPCVLDRSATPGGGATITAFDPRPGDPRLH
jgi:hypothetical protein